STDSWRNWLPSVPAPGTETGETAEAIPEYTSRTKGENRKVARRTFLARAKHARLIRLFI
ncbi:hypothetical protein EKW87_26725, partial [Salmonella enterica]|nr:hypothetical protein [Salmonella enterica]